MRSRVGFTQGLEFRDGELYESTGNIGGTTQLNTITLDGKVTTLADQGRTVFGEGLTILNDEIVAAHLAGAAGLRLRPRRQAQAADAQSARRLGPVATTAPT